jgi:SAM-dependent methyltransferase
MKQPQALPQTHEQQGHYPAKTRYQNERVALAYEAHRFAGPLGALKHWNTQRTIAKAFRLGGLTGSVLDVPCGTGRFHRLLGTFRSWVGADISVQMLGQARAKGPDRTKPAGFIQADAERLPFGDESFDCVMCIRFIQHVPGNLRPRMLRELHRVTRRLLIIEYKVDNPLYNRIRGLLGRKPKAAESREAVLDELSCGGFRVLACLPVSRLFSTSTVLCCTKAT